MVRGKGRRIAAIDIGTNSVHMIVADCRRSGFQVIDKEKEMVLLGRGSLGGNPLTEESMARAVDALVKMEGIARQLRVNEVRAVATSAVREAPNREEFLTRVRESSGIEVEILSGEEEADIIFRAVRASVDFHGGSALSIDIGGGSVELILGTVDEVFFTSSEPLGALRMAQRFLPSEAIDATDIAGCRRHVRRTMKRAFSEIRALEYGLVIGTSGTIVTLAELASAAKAQTDASSGALVPLDAKKLGPMIESLAAVPLAERCRRFGLDERRAESIVGGAVVLDEILRELRVDRIIASQAALREGLILGAVETDARPPQGGVRRRAVLALAKRSGVDRTHANHVAKLALRIFDQTMDLHKLGIPERVLLEYAAFLHEIGVHVSFRGHHKHTYYLIRHAGLAGFTGAQVAILANVARYHRKARPDTSHPNFAELDRSQRKVVRRLAAILRLAVSFDRSRHQAVRDVEVRDNGKLRLLVSAKNDVTIDLDYARHGARALERIFGKKIVIETIPGGENGEE